MDLTWMGFSNDAHMYQKKSGGLRGAKNIYTAWNQQFAPWK